MTSEERAKTYSDYVRMRYTISKKTNSPYMETGHLTPIERANLMRLISEDEQKRNEMFERMESNKLNK